MTNKELVTSRLSSIVERLRALGYSDEDLDTQFDDKAWKWKQLMKQIRPVSDKVWQNIRPQLEETIRLRRLHCGPKFLVNCRERRVQEMKDWLSRYRPKLKHVVSETLFVWQDLLELPIVKELVEEKEYRISMTAERWLPVANVLDEVIPVFSRKIEEDCVKKIGTARQEALEASKSDNDDLDGKQLDEEDEDRIPTHLLLATSLLMHGRQLTSYAELLRKRALESYSWVRDTRVAWDQEKIESSGIIVIIASNLLGHLHLPVETTMAYMAACGNVFRCLQCFHGRESRVMKWPELVQHFTEQNERFENLRRRNKDRGTEVPIRNDHDLESEVDGILVSRTSIVTVNMAPTGENASRYSALSISWGHSARGDGCTVKDEPDDSEDALAEQGITFRENCKLCARLGAEHEERTPDRLRAHMKNKHGTVLEGNLLLLDSTS